MLISFYGGLYRVCHFLRVITDPRCRCRWGRYIHAVFCRICKPIEYYFCHFLYVYHYREVNGKISFDNPTIPLSTFCETLYPPVVAVIALTLRYAELVIAEVQSLVDWSMMVIVLVSQVLGSVVSIL